MARSRRGSVPGGRTAIEVFVLTGTGKVAAALAVLTSLAESISINSASASSVSAENDSNALLGSA